MPYDILLLSCEGGETYNAVPANLEAYLNAGGRAFGSHFHYSWFSGPIGSTQSYTAPTDWGTNLATWTTDQNGGSDPMGGVIDQTLNGSSTPFPKGVALAQWLAKVGALGTAPPPDPATDLAIAAPRYNATVGAANKPSQPWITSDSDGISGQTMYFSFDAPVNAPISPDSGAPAYCGRAVFSDLHVSGATNDDTSQSPRPELPERDSLRTRERRFSSCSSTSRRASSRTPPPRPPRFRRHPRSSRPEVPAPPLERIPPARNAPAPRLRGEVAALGAITSPVDGVASLVVFSAPQHCQGAD